MAIALLLLIYLTFVGLGLPDTVLGSSFPAISEALNLPGDYAGYIGMVVSLFTILSSFLSSFFLQKVKTSVYVFVSVLLTAAGLLLFSFVTAEFWWAFFPIAVLMGFGAGGVDAALNNYVALHYKAVHMNWLHCSWGVGASLGPLLVGAFIDPQTNQGWDWGVRTIAFIQCFIALLLFLGIPLWDKVARKRKEEGEKAPEEEMPVQKGDHRKLLKSPLFYLCAVGFFSYCAMETTTGFWTPSFLYNALGVDSSLSATLGSCFYLGITIGRFLSGLLSFRISPKNLIRGGEGLIILGSLLALMGAFGGNYILSSAGIGLVGLGCAPIYPAIILLTPYRFSRRISQVAMSLQMAVAYMGNLVLSPLFGLFAESLGREGYLLLPIVPLFFGVLMLLVHEIGNRMLSKRDLAMNDEEREQYRIER